MISHLSRRNHSTRAVAAGVAVFMGIWGTTSGAQNTRKPTYPPKPMALPWRADSLPAYVRQQPPGDSIIQRIWDEGMMRSHATSYLQVLSDSLGPRLTGTPEMDRAQHWLQHTYQSLGVPARLEQYGTWEKWERGTTHLDLIAPRVRSLDAMLLGWSPGTEGKTIEGSVVTLPAVTTAAALASWLPSVRGKMVLVSAPRLSCRSMQQWEEYGTPESQKRFAAQQDSVNESWKTRLGFIRDSLFPTLNKAGAVGVLSFRWSGHPGIRKVFGSMNESLPMLSLGCEDYGLLARLAEYNQGPRVRLSADAQTMGEQPVFNVVGEIKGREKPNEYVILGAHFDSWDGGSGTTDNGTGSVVMLEAMRILRAVYPNPKRTILVAHWSGEEEGTQGSLAFAEDHPDILKGLQIAYNQDDGTGRIVSMGAGGLPQIEPVLLRYLSQMPSQITQWIRIEPPSPTANNGSDNATFSCYDVPASSISSLSWDYDFTTWHTDVDTYDKVVDEDLRSNATALAMLAYLASEDSQRIPNGRADLTRAPTPQAHCKKAVRRSADYRRLLF